MDKVDNRLCIRGIFHNTRDTFTIINIGDIIIYDERLIVETNLYFTLQTSPHCKMKLFVSRERFTEIVLL